MVALGEAISAYEYLGPIGGALLLIGWTWFQLTRGTLAKRLSEATEAAADLKRVRDLLEELRETIAVVIIIVQALAEETETVDERAVETALRENGHTVEDFKRDPDPKRGSFALPHRDSDIDPSTDEEVSL